MGETANVVTVVENQPRPAKVPLVAGNSPRAIVPTDFEGAWRISQAVVAAQMAPRGLDTVEKCTIAILHGLEVGLTPMMALQSIAVINGRPSLWGDGALGLIQSSGQLEDQDEHFEGEEGTDSFKAVCVLKRRGKPRPIVGEFSVADAKTAGLWTKRGRDGSPTPWQTYWKRMLKARARAFALRDGFSDVLKGLSVAEEQEDVIRARQPDTPADDGGGPPVPANDDGGGPPVPPQETTSSEPEDGGGPSTPEIVMDKAAVQDAIVTGMRPASELHPENDLDIPDYLRRNPEKPAITDEERDWLESLENAFSSCEDLSSLAEEQDRLMTPQDGKVSAEAWDDACDKLDHHVERVQAQE